MTSTEELESQIHAQDCELEYWFQQAENYAEVQIPADDLRAIIARTYAAVNALPELLAENARLREAFSGPAAWLDRWAQHVGNCKGGHVCTCGLTLARTEACAALKETGQ